MLQQLECENCGKPLSADEIDPHTGLVSCAACGSVYLFRETADGPDSELPPEPVMKPARMEELDKGNRLQISWRWDRPAIAIIFFALFWNGFMAMWYGIAITQRIWIMALFGLLHLGVGVTLIHGIICGFLNRTFIRVSRQRLEVRHLPIWAPNQHRLRTEQIAKLAVCNEFKSENNQSSVVYKLVATLEDGKRVTLVDDLQDSDEALFLRQRLQPFIEDARSARL